MRMVHILTITKRSRWELCFVIAEQYGALYVPIGEPLPERHLVPELILKKLLDTGPVHG